MVGVAKVGVVMVGVVMVGVPKVGVAMVGVVMVGVAMVVWPRSRSAARLEEAEPLPGHPVELVGRHDSAHVGAACVREHALVSI